jgi:hypothetical protein
MDARTEGRIELLHAVGRQEHDALEVLQGAQEDRHKRVSVEFAYGSFGEEQIGFVEEDNGFPPLRTAEGFCEAPLGSVCCGS